MRELHANLLNKGEQRFFDPLILDVDSRKKLRDNIDPNLEVNLLESLSKLLLNLRQISMLEPDL